MAGLTDHERRACWAIARHYTGDGRWGRPRQGPHGAGPWWIDGFMVRKYRPRLVRWERATGRNARKVHALRYRVWASTGFRTPTVRQISVWWCGGQSTSKTEHIIEPSLVCRACLLRINDDSKEVRL